MKTFNTNFGTFILNDNILSMEGSNKTIEIESPDSLSESRLKQIYNVIWNDDVADNPIDELGKIAYGLQAIIPESF